MDEAAARGLLVAIDAALGYPIEASRRGASCPPAPFGRTVAWSPVYQRSDGAFFVVAPPAQAGVSHPPDRAFDAGDVDAVEVPGP